MFQKLIAGSMAGGLPHERMLFEPDPDPSAGGGGGGGGGEPAKTFTQDDVNKIVQREKASLEKKLSDLQKSAEAASKIPELEAKIAELTQQAELAGKSAEEKARIQAEQAAKKIEAERAQREKALADTATALETERSAHRTTRLRYAATAALTEAKAFPQALPDAIGSFLGAVELSFDEKTGEVASITYGGVAQKTMKDAAAAFLKDRPYFAAAPTGGGAGTPTPNGGAPPSGDWKSRSSSELFATALSTPVKGGAGAGPLGDTD